MLEVTTNIRISLTNMTHILDDSYTKEHVAGWLLVAGAE